MIVEFLVLYNLIVGSIVLTFVVFFIGLRLYREWGYLRISRNMRGVPLGVGRLTGSQTLSMGEDKEDKALSLAQENRALLSELTAKVDRILEGPEGER